MKTYNKDKILKEGSMREKIKLYFTHIARGNVMEERKPLLTQEEIMAIYTKIKEPKDIKYYDTLRRYSNLFIQMLKPEIIKNRYNLEKQLYYLSNMIATAENASKTRLKILQQIRINQVEAYKDLLDKLHKYQDLDAEMNSEVIKQAIRESQEMQVKINKEIVKTETEIEKSNTKQAVELDKAIKGCVKEVNEIIDRAKTYLEEYSLYVKKLLPLPIYKEFIQKEEIIAIHTIGNIREIVEKYLNENSIYPPTEPEQKNGVYYIYSWDDLQVDIDERELDFYKQLAYE